MVPGCPHACLSRVRRRRHATFPVSQRTGLSTLWAVAPPARPLWTYAGVHLGVSVGIPAPGAGRDPGSSYRNQCALVAGSDRCTGYELAMSLHRLQLGSATSLLGGVRSGYRTAPPWCRPASPTDARPPNAPRSETLSSDIHRAQSNAA